MFKPMGTPILPYFAAPVGRNVSGGKNYFVSSAARGGLDTNEGTDPEFPLLTIAAAMDLCAQRKNDFIWVQDTPGDSFPIVVDVRNVHIIGCDSGAVHGGRVHIDGGGTAGGVFAPTPTGAGVEIAGFNMYNTGYSCIYSSSTPISWSHFHHCGFGISGATAFGINQATGEFARNTVNDCYFGDDITSGCMFIYGSTESFYIDNIFRGYAGVAVELAHGGVGGIFGNRFFQKQTPDAGYAITLQGAVSGRMIDDNHAMENGGHAGNNPYSDHSSSGGTTCANAWGRNFLGTNVKYPAFLG